MKRILTMLLALCLLIGQAPVTVLAADVVASGTCGENLNWVLDSDGTLTISGTGEMYNYAYPSRAPWRAYGTIQNVVIQDGVTSIGNSAFMYCESITSVELPVGLTSIGVNAFNNCTGLTSIHLPEGLTSIGDDAFWDCSSLTSVYFPDGLTSIGSRAFYECISLTSADLPEGLISIGNSAFCECISLTNVVFPDSLTSIGGAAFSECSSLTSIDLPAGLNSIGSNAFSSCSSLQQTNVSEDNQNYSSDEYGILYNKDKTELIAAPGGIETCSVPSSVTNIWTAAFKGCNKLTSIELPDGVTAINEDTFKGCSKLSSIRLPAGLTSIGNAAFYGCYSLTSIDIPDGVTSIDDFAFAECVGLRSVNLPDGLTFLGWDAFYFCRGLTSIVIPAGLATMGGYVFEQTMYLNSITFLGDAPSFFHASAFYAIEANVYYPADNATWTEDVLSSYGGYITWIPYDEDGNIASGWSGNTQWTLSYEGVLTFSGNGNMRNYDWDGDQPWLSYKDQITSVVIEEGVTSVGSGAFRNHRNLVSVTLPASGLKTIGEAAFYGCSSLKELYIPDGVYTIWEYTFKGCESLEYVRLPQTLIKIDQGAFENCTDLDEIFLPTDTQIIGAWSFKGCTGLTEADMQWADATEIREGAFKNCSALTTIYLPANIQTLGDSCFYGIGAASFTVPATVTSVEPWCFARASLTEITFEGDAPTIGEGAFNKIALTAYYPGDNATWTAENMLGYGGTVTWTAN